MSRRCNSKASPPNAPAAPSRHGVDWAAASVGAVGGLLGVRAGINAITWVFGMALASPAPRLGFSPTAPLMFDELTIYPGDGMGGTSAPQSFLLHSGMVDMTGVPASAPRSHTVPFRTQEPN